MNANELADALQETEPYYSTDYKLFDQAATMLRQQQAEIEALKKEAALQRLSDFTQEADNEPVAWILADKENEYIRSVMIVKHDIVPKDCIEIPLYTHPAKTLTDEEIMVLYEEYIETQYASESNVLGFGRAILRKAQEK